MPKLPARPRPRVGRPQQKRTVVYWALVAAALAIGGMVAAGALGTRSATPEASGDADSLTVMSASAEETTTGTASVEVPYLVGMSVDEAKVLLGSSKISVSVEEAGPVLAAGEAVVVQEQRPQAGTVVAPGGSVVLIVRPSIEETVAETARKSAPKWLVCIDPGHQSHADRSPEPIGPKSAQTKAKISAGVTGVETQIPEYEIALQLSMNLKRALEQQGVGVVLTRTTNDVNLSNADRASISNKAGADIFVRIHGAGSPESGVAGITTLYPASNAWTKKTASPSQRAAASIQRSVVNTTGAPDRGTHARSDHAGFNWSTVPSVLVECGFLSNPVEDRLLASPHYQDKIAAGLAEGIVSFLEAEEAR